MVRRPGHDWLFRHQFALDNGALRHGAREMSIDVDRVRVELAEGTQRERVRDDFASGIKSGVNGTPTFSVIDSATVHVTVQRR